MEPKTEEQPWIVVAEDDDDALELLTTSLEGKGYRVTRARNGQELAAKMTSALIGDKTARYPDLLIADVNMPAYSGLEVLQSFRDAKCDVPAIIVTGDSRVHTKRTALRLGAILLPKPFSMAQVLNEAERILSKRAA